jgi:hypothetical protein
MKVDIASFHLFPYLGPKRTFNTLSSHGDKLTEELLNDATDLKSFEEPIIATLIPNFFVIYCRQKVPHGNITTDKLNAKNDQAWYWLGSLGKRCRRDPFFQQAGQVPHGC